MMKKNIRIFIIIGTIVIILLVAVILIINTINKEKEIIKNNIISINDTYNDYISDISSLTTYKNIYKDIFKEEIFYDNLIDKNDSIVLALNNYKDSFCKLKVKSDKLNNLCSHYYKDNDIVNKCNDYKEKNINITKYYSSDINIYNKLIKGYNEYIEDKDNYKEIELFNSSC